MKTRLGADESEGRLTLPRNEKWRLQDTDTMTLMREKSTSSAGRGCMTGLIGSWTTSAAIGRSYPSCSHAWIASYTCAAVTGRY